MISINRNIIFVIIGIIVGVLIALKKFIEAVLIAIIGLLLYYKKNTIAAMDLCAKQSLHNDNNIQIPSMPANTSNMPKNAFALTPDGADQPSKDDVPHFYEDESVVNPQLLDPYNTYQDKDYVKNLRTEMALNTARFEYPYSNFSELRDGMPMYDSTGNYMMRSVGPDRYLDFDDATCQYAVENSRHAKYAEENRAKVNTNSFRPWIEQELINNDNNDWWADQGQFLSKSFL